MLKTTARNVENFALLRLKTIACQFSQIRRLYRAALRLLMMISAKRDEIILVKPSFEIDRERRDVVH